MSIEVIDGGLFTTVQDMGRHGLQQFGIPVSGVMDTYSAVMANRLVGNSPGAAVLETTLAGPVLCFLKPAIIAFTGCDAPLTLDGVPLTRWESHRIEGGSVLRIGSAVNGCRGYLAVAGGINTPSVMGSRSTFLRGALGGLDGRAIKKGDAVPLGDEGTDALPGRYAPLAQQITLPGDAPALRVMLGPQDDLFTADAKATLLSAVYVITAESDRMGYRMQGPRLSHRQKADILSDGIAPGSIQVPGHGQPIVMLADRQSIGGYAKIATVIGADLPLLSQLKPGQPVRFVNVSREDALTALAQLKSIRDRELCGPDTRRHFAVRVGKDVFRADLQEILGG